jgi:hypothetical protein
VALYMSISLKAKKIKTNNYEISMSIKISTPTAMNIAPCTVQKERITPKVLYVNNPEQPAGAARGWKISHVLSELRRSSTVCPNVELLRSSGAARCTSLPPSCAALTRGYSHFTPSACYRNANQNN